MQKKKNFYNCLFSLPRYGLLFRSLVSLNNNNNNNSNNNNNIIYNIIITKYNNSNNRH